LTFDESLPAFCNAIAEAGHINLIEKGIFVRSIHGSLHLVIPTDIYASLDVAHLNGIVFTKVGQYSDAPPETILKVTDSPTVNDGHLALPERVAVLGHEIVVRVLDRRSAGQDWLRRPSTTEPGPPRMVFWSLKGGVGRTTALVVLAASIAKSGRNVLVVDLDLEAPGVGDLLLSPSEKPEFGVLDYLIEDTIGSVDINTIFSDLISTSTVVQGYGLINVCPAAGKRTILHPQNYMAKLFRSYNSRRRTEADASVSFTDRISQLINRLTADQRYDAVLIDARAGLNESTAAALLGLGGDVLMFGHDTPQTFSGYEYAFSHLSRFAGADDGEWRLMIKMIHAKAPVIAEEQKQFQDQSYELVAKWLYDEDGDVSFALDDTDGMHFPWTILDDSNYRAFDPIGNPALLDSAISNATFGSFIDNARNRLRI
jgi:MinD-like ATPase involved in chromosome partitioning or flagellar assembly